jgi:hypothetical protein
MNKRATENSILKFLTVSSVSSDSIVKESLMAHPIRPLLTSMLRKASILYPSGVYALSFEKYKGK